MEYDETRVYTAKDADKLKAGSKVIVADNMKDLRENVEADKVTKLLRIISDDEPYRFMTRYAGSEIQWMLAYLVEEPKEEELVTNRELAEWLAKGNGQASSSSTNISSVIRFDIIGWNYAHAQDEKAVPSDTLVRRFGERNWYPPTRKFIFGENCE